jgi:four helix bundle protein
MKDEENPVLTKSYSFALKIIEVYKILSANKEYVLSKQLLKSGTSIGANVEEGVGGHSIKDFAARLTIAYKEARETKYWLRLLRDSKYLKEEEANPSITDVDELLKLIGSILRTTKKKIAEEEQRKK